DPPHPSPPASGGEGLQNRYHHPARVSASAPGGPAARGHRETRSRQPEQGVVGRKGQPAPPRKPLVGSSARAPVRHSGARLIAWRLQERVSGCRGGGWVMLLSVVFSATFTNPRPLPTSRVFPLPLATCTGVVQVARSSAGPVPQTEIHVTLQAEIG